MNKPVISLVLWTAGLAAAAAAACSAPDPGVGYLGLPESGGIGGNPATTSQDAGGGGTTPPGGSSGGQDSGSGSMGSSSGGQDSGSSSSADSGTSGGDDAGGSGGGFLGETTPFAANPPATTAAASHAAVGQPAQTPTTDCQQSGCHGPGATVPWLAAGFVAAGAGSTTGAADVEVRVYANGTGYSAQTDTNGFFWINPPAAGVTGTVQGGVRGATGTPLIMPTAQPSPVDCQSASCHGGNTGNIHFP